MDRVCCVGLGRVVANAWFHPWYTLIPAFSPGEKGKDPLSPRERAGVRWLSHPPLIPAFSPGEKGKDSLSSQERVGVR